VGHIEKCVAKEVKTGVVIASWEKNADHEPTCETRNSKSYCQHFKKENEPELPDIRVMLWIYVCVSTTIRPHRLGAPLGRNNLSLITLHSVFIALLSENSVQIPFCSFLFGH